MAKVNELSASPDWSLEFAMLADFIDYLLDADEPPEWWQAGARLARVRLRELVEQLAVVGDAGK